MEFKRLAATVLSAAMVMFVSPVVSYAHSEVSALGSLEATVEVSPRYTNIWDTGASASKSRVYAVMDTYDEMSLSIKAVAYRSGREVDSWSTSGYGDTITLDESASLKSGDVVKFTYKAGGETANDSVTVR